MTKKKIKKVIEVKTVQLPKSEDGKGGDVIAAMQSLQISQGWGIIKEVLNTNISYLEKAILDKTDPITKEAITDAEVEILRIKRSLNIDLRDTPENYSKAVAEKEGIPEEEFDPYFKTKKEIEIARRKPPEPLNL